MNDLVTLVETAISADPTNLALCVALVLSLALLRKEK